MGLAQKLHITVSNDEADSYYQHAQALQDYLLKEADTEQFARWCQLRNQTDVHAALQKMGAVIRAADPRSAPGVSTARSNEATTEFLVALDLDAMEVLRFPFRYVLDRELLRAGETNEPLQILYEDAYVTLGRLAEKLAKADPRVTRIVYEAPGPLFPEDTQSEPETAVENPGGMEPASTAVPRQVKVAYDRSLHCAPILDESTGWTVSGVALFILFDQQFSAVDRDLDICSVPAGADELNALLKVSYAPDLGFSFDPAAIELGWLINEYHFIVDQPTGMSYMEPVDRAEFERFMAENAERFPPDPSLQSASYQLFVERQLADEKSSTETTRQGEKGSNVMGTSGLAPRGNETSGFDFGKGPTALDAHVAWLVTDHHGYDYAKQWTPLQWQISHDCLKAFTHSETHYVMDNTAPLPPWLLKAVDTHARPDTDTPGPSCFSATSTAVDWFTLAKEHPEELVLLVDFEPAPTVKQIENALRAAQARSAEVDLWITCAPPEELGGHFAVSLEALFITPRAGDTEVESIIERELGGVAAFISSAQPQTLEWAWMTQWPDKPSIQPATVKENHS